MRRFSKNLGDIVAAIFLGVILLVLAGALVGCGSPGVREPKVEIREVKVPVPVSCVPKDFPVAPVSYADDDLASAPTPSERYKRVAAASEQRRGRLAVLEPVIQACRQP